MSNGWVSFIKYWDEGLTICFQYWMKKLTRIIPTIEVRHKVAGIYEPIVDSLTVLVGDQI